MTVATSEVSSAHYNNKPFQNTAIFKTVKIDKGLAWFAWTIAYKSFRENGKNLARKSRYLLRCKDPSILCIPFNNKAIA